MQIITSKDNQKIKDLIKLRDDSKVRAKESLFYVEGERIINDTPVNLINSIYIKESEIEKFQYIIEKFNEHIVYIISDDIYDKVKDTINSQGIIALVKENISKNLNINLLSKSNNILILDHIQDPGNLGTILRVAEATAFDYIIISSDTCDVYNTKVIRSTMSSIFRLNIYISNDLINDIKKIKDNNFKVYASTLSNESKSYNNIKYNNKSALIIGNEGSGIKKEILLYADECIKIPMEGQIESLNASIATAVLCYEVYNQSKNICD